MTQQGVQQAKNAPTRAMVILIVFSFAFPIIPGFVRRISSSTTLSVCKENNVVKSSRDFLDHQINRNGGACCCLFTFLNCVLFTEIMLVSGLQLRVSNFVVVFCGMIFFNLLSGQILVPTFSFFFFKSLFCFCFTILFPPL